MFIRSAITAVALLFAALLRAGQADQAAGAEKQKDVQRQEDRTQKEKSTAVADLMGGQRIDQAAAERGRKIFVPTCGFCHFLNFPGTVKAIDYKTGEIRWTHDIGSMGPGLLTTAGNPQLNTWPLERSRPRGGRYAWAVNAR
jgi:cytochrome c5